MSLPAEVVVLVPLMVPALVIAPMHGIDPLIVIDVIVPPASRL